MTTHELANFLDGFRKSLGAFVRVEAARAFEEAVTIFRELPDEPLKSLPARFRQPDTNVRPGGVGRRAVSIDLSAVIASIRAVRSGTTAPDAVTGLDDLNNNHLREVLRAFERKATTTTEGNRALVRQLLVPQPEVDRVPAPAGRAATNTDLVEEGVKLFNQLRDERGLSISDVRARFAPCWAYPKTVLEELSRRLGYTPSGSTANIAERLQANLEALRMNQLRGELVGSGA